MKLLPKRFISAFFFISLFTSPISWANEQHQSYEKSCIGIDVGDNKATPFQRAEASYAICAEMARAVKEDYSRALFVNKISGLSAYRDYANYIYRQRQRAFDLQYFFSIFAFIAAIGFLLFGFYLAHQQFLRDAKDQNKSVSTIKISKDGIEISSSVMGLMVLFLSLLFFYLFLKEVYSISEIESLENKTGTIIQQPERPDEPSNGNTPKP